MKLGLVRSAESACLRISRCSASADRPRRAARRFSAATSSCSICLTTNCAIVLSLIALAFPKFQRWTSSEDFSLAPDTQRVASECWVEGPPCAYGGDDFVAPLVGGSGSHDESRIGHAARPTMTLELLIQAIVRQTTLLIAQLATYGGARAPLAQVADQVFIDLVRELERQGVSRRVSADMFGLGLRTYQRKIQRLSESKTDRGRSLWEAILEHIRQNEPVTRAKLCLRFARDDESLVRSVLHDLCESQLIVAAQSNGGSPSYQIAPKDQLEVPGQGSAQLGLDELVWAMVYRLGPVSAAELELGMHSARAEVDAALLRLVEAGRVEAEQGSNEVRYRSVNLVIPLGSPVGWEAAVFDHYKAMVNTITSRLDPDSASGVAARQIGGSTFTLDVWDGHPMADEVVTNLAQFRAALSEQRRRVEEYNEQHGVPADHKRVLVYCGQCVIAESGEENEETRRN